MNKHPCKYANVMQQARVKKNKTTHSDILKKNYAFKTRTLICYVNHELADFWNVILICEYTLNGLCRGLVCINKFAAETGKK